VFVALSLLQARPAARPYTIAYAIAMPDVASHLYTITLTAAGLTGRSVDLQMPVWSPGRYGRMDFAKNVQDFAVSGSDGQPLRWTKVDGSLWRVSTGASRSVHVTYRCSCT
jgi:predicted metalloprotease with PDZ domain